MAATFAKIISFPRARGNLPSLPSSSRSHLFSSRTSLSTALATSPLRTHPAIAKHRSSPSSYSFNALSSDFDSSPGSLPFPPFLLKRIVFTALLLVLCFFVSGISLAADDSIKASGLGLKVAEALRRLAILPVLELRGAIPVGYWMHLNPLLLTILSILGNMVPVPFIIIYLKRFAEFVSQKSASATQFLDFIFKRAREKAGPVEEFQWLGLMLFVAVPFPGTGAWTGAIIALVLDMPFWSAITANFVGVVLAGLLVNLVMNLGLKYAVATGVVLFFISTIMWSVLCKSKQRIYNRE
ncbi:putative small multi-drug export protein [Dioscorea alata]|uniref:Small multi-drug export protein n=1 Tax=Dioscorea alata TaxID=55571 RepID=A0ACB7VMX4_DIOAL|nr:putative small multi-drug export protein [Dioscorea alata]